MVRRVDNASRKFNIKHLKDRSVFHLSSGEKQKVAFASVYAMSPKMFIIDEPSSNLDIASTFRLRALLQSLKEEGHTVIIAEHKLYYSRDLFDGVIYLDKGKIVNESEVKDMENLSLEELKRKGLCTFDLNKVKMRPNKILTDRDLKLTVNDLGFRYSKKGDLILKGINLELNADEIVALVGPNGSGKTTFIKVLSGLLKRTDGSIQVNGQIMNAKDRIKHSHLVMQEAEHQLFTERVDKELELASDKNVDHTKIVEETLSTLNLTNLKDRHLYSLLGGQKQRLAIAIVRNPDIIILDEPTSGMDGRSMSEFSDILRPLAIKGHIIIVVTHDYEFVTSACTRVILLNDGIIQADCPIDRMSKKLKNYFFPHSQIELKGARWKKVVEKTEYICNVDMNKFYEIHSVPSEGMALI